MRKTTKNFLTTTLFYFLFGKLGLFLAIPPGFASTVWPAAGVALAFGLTLDKGVFLGVIIGSFLNNLLPFINAGHDFNNLTPLISGLLIGLGAAVQMLIGKNLIFRVSKDDIDYKKSTTILKVVLFAIPLSCLTNALWGSFILYQFNIISLNDYFFSSVTWFIGDTLGACVFTPLFLSFLNKSEIWIRRKTVFSIPMTLLTSLVILLFVLDRNDESKNIQQNFDEQVRELTIEIEKTMKGGEEVVEYLKDYILTEELLTSKKFKSYTQNILERHKEIKALSWNPVLTDKERTEFEKKIKAEGFSNFRVTTKKDGKFTLSENKNQYVIVGYIEPYEKNKIAHGYDISSDPSRSETIETAKRTKKLTATAPIKLVQDSGEKLGYLYLNPIFKNEKLNSFSVAVINIYEIFKNRLSDNIPSGIEIFIFDITDPSSETPLIYSNSNKTGSYQSIKEFAQGSDKIHSKFQIDSNSRKWEIYFCLSLNYIKENQSLQSWFIIGSGFFITIVTGVFILILTGRENILKSISEELKASKISLQNFSQGLEATIRERTKELENAHRIKSMFLANMSHEIRTPLNGILGALQLLEDDYKNTKNDLINSMRFSGNLLLSIVNDILDLSKIETDKILLENRPLDLINLANQAIETVKYTLNNNNKFTLSYDINQKYLVISDQNRISQILTNLLSNANKFTSNGTINVSLAVKEKRDDYGLFEISISDTGIGISKENIKKLFTPFTQADETMTRKFGGTGLGLSICKGLAHLLGGDVSVESVLNKGTKFTVTLLLKITEDLKDKDKVRILKHDFSNYNALVAEDNEINQKIIRAFLEKYNINVFCVSSGKEAIDFIEKNKIDIVFMDYNMPILNGIEATKIIRSKISKTVKIIAVTASVTKELRDQYLSAGMNDIISKPISREALLEILNKELS